VRQDILYKCAVREFYSGGTISDGLTIDKIFTSVRTGSAYRRRPEGDESTADSPLAKADWLLQKISFDEQYYFLRASVGWRGVSEYPSCIDTRGGTT
jgi:hypothetical protein